MARCGFATGAVEDDKTTAVPSIEAAVDVVLNIRELGANRQPDGIRHATDEQPAPGALSLVEIADAIGHLFEFVAVTTSAAQNLLPQPQPKTARVGAWVSVSGGLADRVIDLRMFRRVPRSTGMSQAAAAFRLELGGQSSLSEDDIQAFVANLLYEGLERGGYRDLDEVMEEIRRGRGSRA
jgi:hypothetical protein